MVSDIRVMFFMAFDRLQRLWSDPELESSGGAEQSDGRGSVWSRPGGGGTSFPELSWACTKSAA